ncbi:hypothetical protein [Endozoicomonas atrinae]|uniref:hypothetical protein n=1 Tax=Endozoicomonas atrinae TaxID=1333660 RepID=UPI003B00FBE8
MNGSAIFNGFAYAARTFTSSVAPMARPAAMYLAGRYGGGAAVQFGPWAVKTVVNYTTPGYIARFFYQQSLNAALGPYFYPAGQLLFSSAAAVVPGPIEIADKVRTHNHHKGYLAELRRSNFDPKRLEVEEVEEGFLNYTYESLPVDESTYSFIDKEEADSLPKLPVPSSGKCDQFEMNTYKDVKTDSSGVKETAL